MEQLFNYISETISTIDPIVVRGRITEVVGLLIKSSGPATSVGNVCYILNKNDEKIGEAEVVGFSRSDTLLMPLGTIDGLQPGDTVVSTGQPLTVKTGDALLGRILDGLGNPMDGKGAIKSTLSRPTTADVPDPLSRNRITDVFETGIRAIDGALTMGEGQRLGIFAGSGVGKSVLMGMIAKNCRADVNVIVLVGERGREVREFIERDLGSEGLSRSVVVVATSDKPALIRLKATMVAATIAEYFRDQGKKVMFMCDSVTRLAMAQREIGLTVGEPPASKGYTPSVFAMLPQFLERAGNSDKGSITALYTVLVEGGDMDEPIADATRGILDGHILLSRDLAHKNHFPAIDLLHSISRCQKEIVDEAQSDHVGKLRDIMTVFRDNEDLINIGAYERGSSAKIDMAIELTPHINSYLKQGINEYSSFDESKINLIQLMAQVE